jgi:hypothetical protein
LLADFSHFVERQFARQYDAVDADFLPETHRRQGNRMNDTVVDRRNTR